MYVNARISHIMAVTTTLALHAAERIDEYPGRLISQETCGGLVLPFQAIIV